MVPALAGLYYHRQQKGSKGQQDFKPRRVSGLTSEFCFLKE
uniref:Uncharacterized protein n=1 Tax=Anguilla anguilla TaxID=7936 RepID=A0A0E9PIY2_ANGAN